VLVHERGDAIKELPLLGGDVEIHGASQSLFFKRLFEVVVAPG
jgi:hypothetical protein